jgi:hypothetical protein
VLPTWSIGVMVAGGACLVGASTAAAVYGRRRLHRQRLRRMYTFDEVDMDADKAAEDPTPMTDTSDIIVTVAPGTGSSVDVARRNSSVDRRTTAAKPRGTPVVSVV